MIVTFPLDELKSLLRKELAPEDIARAFDMLGAPVESHSGESIEVEVFPNRVDLLSPEGAARALRGILGIETGYPVWDIVPGKLETRIEKTSRPFVSFSAVLGAEISETSLAMLMQMQEKLHLTVGRDRKKYSIGVYDFDHLKSPISYKELPLKDIVFVPLGGRKEMNGREILKKTEKGRKYAHLVGETAPVLVDGAGRIISMAPIINAEFCKVTPETRNFFIDSTGTAEGTDAMVALIATSLAERGGKLGVVVPGPSYLPRRMKVSRQYIRKRIGTRISDREIVESLEKMRLGYDGDVLIPPYRIDVFSPLDVAEDAAIGYGHEKFSGELLPSYHSGKAHPSRLLEDKARQVMVGLGFLEAKTFLLTSPELLSLAEEPKEVVNNPKSKEYSALRPSLLPGLYNLLMANKHAEYPQRVFEVGTVFTPEEELRLAGLVAHPEASFSEVKGIVDRVLSLFGKSSKWEAGEHRFFIPGRTALSPFGVYGEVSLELAEKLGLGSRSYELVRAE